MNELVIEVECFLFNAAFCILASDLIVEVK